MFVPERQELRIRLAVREGNSELLNCPLRQVRRLGKFGFSMDVVASRSTSTNRASAEDELGCRKEETKASDTMLMLASMEQSQLPSVLDRLGYSVTPSPIN